MTDVTSNNKRIAKNTLLLYFRMILNMLVTLYTSRIILNALGVEDYGIYNVIGGLVAMFSLISGALSAAISRYITFELGNNDYKKLAKIFSTSVITQILISIIVVLIAETAGMWFLNMKMVIPIDRMVASNWLFQFSIITFIVNLISVPYNAIIIAYEQMSIFAYISIYEVFAKLLVAFLLYISPFDKLIWYGLLLMVVSISVRIIYGIYCKRNFNECNQKLLFDYSLMKEMFCFAGWNFIGSASGILRDQGGNILINLFYGPTVNAARGIAMQISTAVSSFATNFMIALNPQITKSYANGNHSYMMSLIYKGARFSYYMLLIISLPIFISTSYILGLWLNIVPEYTIQFVRLIIILVLAESISSPLITAMLATGNIRNYQILVGGLQILNLPISYILLQIGANPDVTIIIAIIISQLCLIARLYMLKNMIKLNTLSFIRNVYFNIILVTLSSAIIPFLIKENFSHTFGGFIIISFITFTTTLLSIMYIGFNKEERAGILNKLYQLKYKTFKQ